MQSVPDLNAALERPPEARSIAVGDAAARGGGADKKDGCAARHRILDGRHNGYALADADAIGRVLPRPRRVDDGDDRERRVPQHSDRGLGGGGRELSLGEDRDLHPPRSGPCRRKRPCRSRVVSPRSSATPPFTITY